MLHYEGAFLFLFLLSRGMEFIYLFLAELARGETALDIAAGKAYTKSLRRHHNWMIRGIFSVSNTHTHSLSVSVIY